MEPPFYFMPVNMAATVRSLCMLFGIRKTGRRAELSPLRGRVPLLFLAFSSFRPFLCGCQSRGRVPRTPRCPRSALRVGVGGGARQASLPSGWWRLVYLPRPCSQRDSSPIVTEGRASLQLFRLRLGDWLALGPADSRWAPARLPWGGCKCPQLESQPFARPQKGSKPVKHLSSALPATAEVYIGIGKPAEATACTQEAANLFPMSHNVLYMRGQVAELRGNLDEARRWYEEALSISPTHVKSMQRLVSLRARPGPRSRAGAPLGATGGSPPVRRPMWLACQAVTQHRASGAISVWFMEPLGVGGAQPWQPCPAVLFCPRGRHESLVSWALPLSPWSLCCHLGRVSPPWETPACLRGYWLTGASCQRRAGWALWYREDPAKSPGFHTARGVVAPQKCMCARSLGAAWLLLSLPCVESAVPPPRFQWSGGAD